MFKDKVVLLLIALVIWCFSWGFFAGQHYESERGQKEQDDHHKALILNDSLSNTSIETEIYRFNKNIIDSLDKTIKAGSIKSTH